MKELFMSIVNILVHQGNLISANMYPNGKYSTITIETPDGKYDISIMKKDEDEN